MESEGPNGKAVEIRPGARYRCPTCPTEVVVVKGEGRGRLTCGSAPMFDPASADDPASAGAVETAAPGPDVASPGDPDSEDAILLGKRYGDPDDAVEVLCTKAGSGPLGLDGAVLSAKAPKPLPASD